MQNVFALITFVCASVYVLILDYLAVSPQALQKALVVPLIILVLVFYLFPKHSWRNFLITRGKWLLLFEGVILVQLLVLSTGGLQSPFLILIHLFMIATSFIFSFFISLSFLMLSILTMSISLISHPESVNELLQTPGTLVLQVASLIVIIPIAYIVSLKYHTKDVIFGLLREKVKTDEAIFQTLDELIIVTDPELRILSVNNAVEKALQRSQSELIERKLFDILLLRDTQGKLMKRGDFFPDEDTSQNPKRNKEEFTLLASATSQQTVTVSIQSIKHTGADVSSISFILTDKHSQESSATVILDTARAKYEALMQHLKKDISSAHLPQLETKMQLLEKIEQDTYLLQQIPSLPTTRARIDLAQLCKQVVLRNQSFADSYSVTLSFALPHFGMKDIEPLTVKDYPVKPEQLTGPFFTAMCDVDLIETVIKKLVDLSIFLASSEHQKEVMVNVERGKNDDIVISLIGNAPFIAKDSLSDLFQPYYGDLQNNTEANTGSGLEGYLVKKITEKLHIPLQTTMERISEGSQMRFTLYVPKK